MSILTKQQFIAQASSRSRKVTFSATVREALNESKTGKAVSIFLSHSHHDKDMIEAGIVLFKGLNISVYVDWADQTMPEVPNGITASKIKEKIQTNDKFILLATNNAVVSKWCNWELGYGDAKKFQQDNLAIIPLAENNGDWKGNEYLQMYPHIEQGDQDRARVKVVYPNGKSKWLEDWLDK